MNGFDNLSAILEVIPHWLRRRTAQIEVGETHPLVYDWSRLQSWKLLLIGSKFRFRLKSENYHIKQVIKQKNLKLIFKKFNISISSFQILFLINKKKIKLKTNIKKYYHNNLTYMFINTKTKLYVQSLLSQILI